MSLYVWLSSRPLTGYAFAELPYARKASLARFLEKRKDRYHISP
jgi:hypothetical protein